MGLLGYWLKLKMFNFEPKKSSKISTQDKADSDIICKDIDAEDLGAATLCGKPTAMNSAPTPNATSPMPLWNQSISNTRNKARSESLGEKADSNAICKDNNAEDLGAATLCGKPTAMNSAPTPNASNATMESINSKHKKSSKICKLGRWS